MSYKITDACNGCQACVKICPVDAISGEKKKTHIIDGSQCLDCGACGRICPQGAVLDHAGRICVMVKRSEWKKPQIDQALCTSCAVCVDSCPVNCLGLRESIEVRDPHMYPYLNKDKDCLGCRFCESDCPVDAIRMVSQ